MATKETTPESLAKKAFIVTMVGAALYITVVFVFVIGGNRREEASGTGTMKAPAYEQAEHHD